MKEIKDPGVVLVFTTDGKPVMATEPGPDGKPTQVHAFIDMYHFLLDGVGNAKFTEGMSGIDAILFAADAKREIEQQKTEATARGSWHLEDDRAKRMREAKLNPTGGYNPALQHNLVPLVVNVRDMRDVKRDAS